MTLTGYSREGNAKLSAKYLLRAAELGDDKAIVAVGKNLRRGLNGFEKDSVRAFAWFLEASKQSNDEGLLEIADLLLTSAPTDQIPPDPKAAQEYLRRVTDSQHQSRVDELQRLFKE